MAGCRSWAGLQLWQSQPPLPCMLLALPAPQSYEAAEDLVADQQRQDWSLFEYAGQLVCRDVEGWQAVVSALPAKPALLREPCPDLALDRFTPTGEGQQARVYTSDLARAWVGGGAGAAPAAWLLVGRGLGGELLPGVCCSCSWRRRAGCRLSSSSSIPSPNACRSVGRASGARGRRCLRPGRAGRALRV